MSLFVETMCEIEGDTWCCQLAWSRSDPIAALITNTVDENDKEIHGVMFMNAEGSLVKNASITHNKEATAVDWQPNGHLLAIGWEDGESVLT